MIRARVEEDVKTYPRGDGDADCDGGVQKDSGGGKVVGGTSGDETRACVAGRGSRGARSLLEM